MGDNIRLGGSHAGVIYGVDEYRDEHTLWLELTNQIPRKESTVETTTGKACEQGLAEILYPFLTGRPATFYNKRHEHPTEEALAATPDAFCQLEQRGIEIKTASYHARHKWGDTPESVPYSAQLQIQYYMQFFGVPYWDLLCLRAGEPVLYEYERNRELGEEIFARLREWWQRYLQGHDIPPVGGSKSTKDWIAERFPNHRRPDVRPASEEEIDLLLDYENHKILAKEIEDELDILENRVRAAIAEREGIEWYAGRVTWRKTRDSSKTDWQGLAMELMERYLEEPERATMESAYTRTVEGYRRLLLHSEAYRDATRAA